LGLRMLQFEVREGFQLLSDATEVRLDEVTDVAYDGTLTLGMTAAGLSWVEVNELEIREGVRGKSVAEAEEYLTRHLSLAEDPTIEVSPAWWGRLPWLPFQITVEVVS
jgi:sirohydrochlorin ferrochelatase